MFAELSKQGPSVFLQYIPISSAFLPPVTVMHLSNRSIALFRRDSQDMASTTNIKTEKHVICVQRYHSVYGSDDMHVLALRCTGAHRFVFDGPEDSTWISHRLWHFYCTRSSAGPLVLRKPSTNDRHVRIDRVNVESGPQRYDDLRRSCQLLLVAHLRLSQTGMSDS